MTATLVERVDLARESEERVIAVKTITCRQLGGPCDAPLRGSKADEVIKAQDKHLKEVVSGGDGTHQSALTSMQERWKHPIAGLGWYRQTKKDFAALAED